MTKNVSIPIHILQYVIRVENLPWAYRIFGIYIHKMYQKFGTRINCNMRMACWVNFRSLAYPFEY